MAYSNAKKTEVIKLRREQQLSLKQLQKMTGVAKSTLSLWLRDYPLDKKLVRDRMRANARKTNEKRPTGWYTELASSDYYDYLQNWRSDRRVVMKISEAAILFRLAIHGFEVWPGFFDGTKVDFLVQSSPSSAVQKVQVRTTRKSSKHGVPQVSLLCSDGRTKSRRYRDDEFDFLAAYDLSTDKAFVWSSEELKQNSCTVSITREAMERWDKIRVRSSTGRALA